VLDELSTLQRVTSPPERDKKKLNNFKIVEFYLLQNII
jgi:hypothetical protein